MKFKIFLTAFLIIVMNSISFAQKINISTKNFSDEKSGSYKINIDYPQVDFGPDALMGARGNAQDINNSLDSIVNSIKDEFVKQVSELPEMKDLDAESEMAINGVGWINNNHLICTQLINYTYIKGTAHPMTTNTTFNYTIDGEGPLGFSSLFRNDKEYLNYISTICIRDLETKLNDEDDNLSDMITDGASADMKNFSNWSVENDKLIIIFNPYQVAPYVYGMQSVGIPLNELMEYIDPKGPLEYMFR